MSRRQAHAGERHAPGRTHSGGPRRRGPRLTPVVLATAVALAGAGNAPARTAAEPPSPAVSPALRQVPQVPLPPSASQGGRPRAAAAAGAATVRVRSAGDIDIRVRDYPLHALLEELCRKAGVELEVVQIPDRRISASVQHADLRRALETVLAGESFALGTRNDGRRWLHVLGRGAEPPPPAITVGRPPSSAGELFAGLPSAGSEAVRAAPAATHREAARDAWLESFLTDRRRRQAFLELPLEQMLAALAAVENAEALLEAIARQAEEGWVRLRATKLLALLVRAEVRAEAGPADFALDGPWGLVPAEALATPDETRRDALAMELAGRLEDDATLRKAFFAADPDALAAELAASPGAEALLLALRRGSANPWVMLRIQYLLDGVRALRSEPADSPGAAHDVGAPQAAPSGVGADAPSR